MVEYTSKTVKEISYFLNLPFEGENISINGVSPYNDLQPGTLSFTNADVIDKDICALVLCKETAVIETNNITVIRVPNPRYCFAKISSEYLAKSLDYTIHQSSIIDPSVDLPKNIEIGAFSLIESSVKIGSNTRIGSNVIIRKGTQIGNNSVIKSGAIIGDQGFGFGFSDDKTPQRIPHNGGVIVGDNVEVGSNNVICSGTFNPTIIEDNVKLDDLVFIAHNCKIGNKTMIAACAQLSGSVSIGSSCWIGPNCSIINKAKIGNHVTVGIGSVVTKNIEDNFKVMGLNALPLKELVGFKKRMRSKN